MMMSLIKQVLIFGVGLVVALGLCPLMINTKNTKLSYFPPQQHNTIKDTNQLTIAIPRPAGFDYFVLALQWSAAFCNIQSNRPRKCIPNHPLAKHRDKFTIHGLWPQLNDAEFLSDCSSVKKAMTPNDIQKIRNDLLSYWPNLFDAQSVSRSCNSFWMKQWEKHGSCSSDMYDGQQYLDMTINLAKQYSQPIFGELVRRGINPDGTSPHSSAGIRQAVRHIMKDEPMPNMQLNDLGELVLLEIHLCVKKDGKTLFDCDPRYKFAAS